MTLFWRRMGHALPWLTVGSAAVCVTLLVMLPAAWITPQFAKASGARVSLVEPAGSLWHGSATLMLAPGADRQNATVLPGRIEWTTAFWPLFVGRLHMRMQHGSMTGPIMLDATRNGATLTSGSLLVPASLLTGLGAPFNTLDLQGDVRLAWTDLRIIGRQSYGQLTVVLSDMASRVSRVRPLGSYKVVFAAQGESATLALTTTKGPLLLEGTGTLNDARVMFSGTARAAPAERDNLIGLLNLLGRRIDDDTVALAFAR